MQRLFQSALLGSYYRVFSITLNRMSSRVMSSTSSGTVASEIVFDNRSLRELFIDEQSAKLAPEQHFEDEYAQWCSATADVRLDTVDEEAPRRAIKPPRPQQRCQCGREHSDDEDADANPSPNNEGADDDDGFDNFWDDHIGGAHWSQESRAGGVPGASFSRVLPTPVRAPRLQCVSSALDLLFDRSVSARVNRSTEAADEVAALLSGNALFDGSEPAAHCYCGYQFGYFSGQLGDGRAIYLGEAVTSNGERWEVQLKGAGRTPYSRGADGRAVLRSSVREFLCSEHMHALGVPTTRAGSLVVSYRTRVIRDKRYDGNAAFEPTAIVSRIASTFIRFGSFEVCKSRDEHTGREGPSVALRTYVLPTLISFVARHFYPSLLGADELKEGATLSQQSVVRVFEEVCRRTAHMVAHWQAVGFAHGVMNTDNMSIVGVTLDYGPFGFLDEYDPSFVCNSSDNDGRYAFAEQPRVCRWNCMKLAEAWALSGLVDERALLDALDRVFWRAYHAKRSELQCRKLGLIDVLDSGFKETDVVFSEKISTHSGDEDRDEITSPYQMACEEATRDDDRLYEALLDTMFESGADFTNTHRALHRCVPLPRTETEAIELADALASDTPHEHLPTVARNAVDTLVRQCASARRFAQLIEPSQSDRQILAFIAHAAQNDPSQLRYVNKSQEWVTRTIRAFESYEVRRKWTDAEKRAADRLRWRTWLSAYLRRLAPIAKGLDEAGYDALQRRRDEVMCAANPRVVLRNYQAELAIRSAERHADFAEVHRLLGVMTRPYARGDDEQSDGAVAPPTETVDAERGDRFAHQCVVYGTDESKVNANASDYTRRPPSWSCSLSVSCSS